MKKLIAGLAGLLCLGATVHASTITIEVTSYDFIENQDVLDVASSIFPLGLRGEIEYFISPSIMFESVIDVNDQPAVVISDRNFDSGADPINGIGVRFANGYNTSGPISFFFFGGESQTADGRDTAQTLDGNLDANNNGSGATYEPPAGSPLGAFEELAFELSLSLSDIDLRPLNSTEELVDVINAEALVMGTIVFNDVDRLTPSFTVNFERVQTVSEVPLPAAAWFFLSGLGGLLAVRRKSKS